ncbi:MAG: DNA alkylation repair protein [Lachnospiraceae bacterium]|nr:DNA alkylation repair protein [Lachnospiraceae bacterium]
MNCDEIVAELFRLQDKEYAAFQAKLIPTVEADRIIGVRTPELRSLSKKLFKDEDTASFLTFLPHRYFEEDQLHAFVISLEKDFGKCIAEVEAFLPFIDNWATCDQLSPKAFKKEPEKLLPYICTWIKSDKVYTVRFAIGMLMQHFLDARFDPKYADMVAAVRSEEYYINMMIAWFFATALAKQYASILPYLEGKKLDDWTHNKAIQKSVESYRITAEQKAYLKTLKVGRQPCGSISALAKSR